MARVVWRFLAVSLCLGLAAPAWSQGSGLPEQINKAIDKGVAFLKKHYQTTKNIGVFGGLEAKFRTGARALGGWTLLESGVPAQDEVVKELADETRQAAVSMDQTYNISVAIIFLDKLGDPGDKPLIQNLALRLLAGQNQLGGWTYTCPVPSQAEQGRLNEWVQAMKAKRDQGQEIKLKERKPKELHQDLVQQYQRLQVGAAGPVTDMRGDNSNTHFAMMALWVAHRNDVPVHKALAAADQRFRNFPNKDGSWGYMLQDPKFPSLIQGPTEKHPSMTCIGLLGLALGQAHLEKPKNLTQDPAVKKALTILSKYLEAGPPEKDGNFFYFLFSLERMSVIYDLKKVGETDWYHWGARHLVDTQAMDGSWPGAYRQFTADTCFALLFLKRANIASDLTEILKGNPPIRKSSGKKEDPFDLPVPLPKDKDKDKIRKGGSDPKKSTSSAPLPGRPVTPVWGPPLENGWREAVSLQAHRRLERL